MVRFLRNWLVWILAGMMLAGIAIAFIPLSKREETRATNELALLLDRAFRAIDEGKAYADPVVEAEEENLINKAHAIVRFLEHDDTLLATDALAAFCEQLGVDRIDVANLQGELIASSDASRVGLLLGKEEAFAWTMEAADDPIAALKHADENDRSLLYACVGRTEIDGFVLLTRDDPFVDAALEKFGTEVLLGELPYNGDLVFEATAGGADGSFYDVGSLCLRKTQDGVTLIAARSTGDVFRMRNTALAAIAVMMICLVICGVAAYLLRLEPVVELEEASSEREDDASHGEQEALFETEATANEADDADREMQHQHEQAKKRTPRQIKRGESRRAPSSESETGDEPFDKTIE
jgi:cbb3-type cytochrome oxidase subunit 3